MVCADAVHDLVDTVEKREAIAAALGVPVEHAVTLNKKVGASLKAMKDNGTRVTAPQLYYYWSLFGTASATHVDYTIIEWGSLVCTCMNAFRDRKVAEHGSNGLGNDYGR